MTGFTLTAEGAVRLILLNYEAEQNLPKTELLLIRLVNEAYNQGKAAGSSEQHKPEHS